MLHRVQQNLMGEERAALDQLVDTGNVHLDKASGADIEMPNFAVAHLPLGQADERAVGADQRVRIVLPQPIEVGLRAIRTALFSGFGLCPQPSMMVRTKGRDVP